jgi:hypothetical protein
MEYQKLLFTIDRLRVSIKDFSFATGCEELNPQELDNSKINRRKFDNEIR